MEKICVSFFSPPNLKRRSRGKNHAKIFFAEYCQTSLLSCAKFFTSKAFSSGKGDGHEMTEPGSLDNFYLVATKVSCY